MRDGGEIFGDLLPILNSDETGIGEIVRRGEEEALAFEAKEIARKIVDEVVGAEDGLVAAEDVMGGRDEGEVALEPSILGTERVGHDHGLGGDEDFKTGGEILKGFLRAGDEGKILEEIFGIEEGAKLLLAIVRSELPDSLAGKVLDSDGFVEGLVVTAEVLGERVCHDFIHIDADALHEGSGQITVNSGQWSVVSEQ